MELLDSWLQSEQVCGGGLSSSGRAYFDKCLVHIEHSEMITFLHSKFSVHSNLERKKKHLEVDSCELLVLGGNIQ